MPLFETPGPLPDQSTGLEGLGEIVKQVYQALMSPELQAKLLSFKIIFILLFLGFLAVFIYFLLTTSYIKWKWLNGIMNFFFPNFDMTKRLRRRWEKLKQKVDKAHSEPERKLALLGAAALVIKFLPKSAVDELTKDDVTDLGEFLEAYRTIEVIKQDLTYVLEKKEADDIINIFEKALIDLNVLS